MGLESDPAQSHGQLYSNDLSKDQKISSGAKSDQNQEADLQQQKNQIKVSITLNPLTELDF